jgi:hypothetical protein
MVIVAIFRRSDPFKRLLDEIGAASAALGSIRESPMRGRKTKELAMRFLVRGFFGLCLVGSSAVFGQSNLLPNLTSRLVVVRFSIGMGRIEANSDNAGFEREQSSTIEPGRHETLSVQTNNDQEASVKYELTTEDEKLSVTVSDGYDVAISRHPINKPHGAQVDFRQPRAGAITLTVLQEGATREVRGQTVWYLLLAEPELCRQHLLPLLSMLRSDWRLVETAQAIEAQMLRIAGTYQSENLHRWGALVDDLASERFAVRQSAERDLRTEGTIVIPYLESLDRHRLDLEQWSRIRGIVDSQSESAEDTPEQEACHLMDDRPLWIVLASRPRESTRRMAAHQLAFLLGRAIQFDPGAAEPVRKEQLAALRKQIGSGAAAAKPSDASK